MAFRRRWDINLVLKSASLSISISRNPYIRLYSEDSESGDFDSGMGSWSVSLSTEVFFDVALLSLHLRCKLLTMFLPAG